MMLLHSDHAAVFAYILQLHIYDDLRTPGQNLVVG